MKKNYFILCLFIFCVQSIFAQTEFNKQIWRNDIKEGNVSQVQDITELTSGNLAILSTGEEGYSQLTLVKRTGETIRNISFNKKKSQLFSIKQLPDGNLIMAGCIFPGKDVRKQGWLVLVSKHGDIIWEKQYGAGKDDVFKRIEIFNDGGLMIAGETKSGNNSKGNLWLLKINLEGNIVWQREHGTENTDVVNSLIKLNNGFVVGGQSVRGSEENALLLKVNLDGNEIWRKRFSEETSIYNGIQAFDDKLIYIGYIFNNEGRIQRDAWAIKISPNDGNVLWEESYRDEYFKATNDDIGYDLIELIDGRIMLVGKSYSNSAGSSISNVWHLTVESHDGRSKDDIQFFDSKKNGYATYIQYANNRDLMIAGSWDEQPYISRYKTATQKKPTIKWDKYRGNIEVIPVGLNDDSTFLELEATIISPVLIKKDDIRMYWNKRIQLNDKYYKNLVLGKPYKSTDNKDQFVYKVFNRIPITKKDSIVEIRLYNNLFSVKSSEYQFKLLKDFEIDIFWMNHTEGNLQRPLPKLVADNNLTVKLMIECTEQIKNKSFELLINGRRTEGTKYGETVLDTRGYLKKKKEEEIQNKYQYTYLNNVYLKKGENRIKLEVRIDGKTYSSRELVRVYNGKDEVSGYLKVDTTFSRNLSNLHVLAIGVEHSDLKYTVQDAKDIASAFKSLEGKGLFKEVNVETLVGKEANKTEIDIALERYKNAYRVGEITNKDLFVLFISSHGFIYKDSIAGANDWIKFEKFLIQASNFDNAAKEATSVAYENVVSTLAAIRCKKVVLIDACFSGGVQRARVSNADNESINNLITQMSFQQPGLVTITSSTKSQPSYEDPSWQNGAFTEAIIHAFKNGDINGDKVVTLSEMYGHIARRIPYIVENVKDKTQKPTITNNKLSNIPIFEMD